MDSSILELQDAIGSLTGLVRGYATGGATGSINTGLPSLRSHCQEISSIFDEANPSLSAGWNTASKVFDELNHAITETLRKVYEGLEKFANETYQAELDAKKAVDHVNDVAQKILSDLKEMGFSSSSVPFTPPAAPPTPPVQ